MQQQVQNEPGIGNRLFGIKNSNFISNSKSHLPKITTPGPSYLVNRTLFVVLSLIIFSTSFAQVPTQQLRGSVVDHVLQTAIEGATVRISGIEKTVITNANGEFRFTAVPIGVQQLVISCVGYKELVLDNINLNSGKETVLNINLENSVQA